MLHIHDSVNNKFRNTFVDRLKDMNASVAWWSDYHCSSSMRGGGGVLLNAFIVQGIIVCPFMKGGGGGACNCHNDIVCGTLWAFCDLLVKTSTDSVVYF